MSQAKNSFLVERISCSGLPKEGQTILESMLEDAGTIQGSAEVLGPGDLGQITKGQLHALWQDAKTFAHCTGRESMKGALFEAALETIEALLENIPPPGIDDSDLN